MRNTVSTNQEMMWKDSLNVKYILIDIYRYA